MTEPLRFYPNRVKWIVVGLACAIMTAGGIFVVTDGHWLGLLPATFFGLGLIVSLILLWPSSSYLELDSTGFVIRNLFRDSRIPWVDVDYFEARRVGLRKMVTLNFAPNYKALPNARAVTRAISGVDGALPDTYGMSADDLARMMNDHLQGCVSENGSIASNDGAT